MNLQRFIDPDRAWFRSDKYQHGASWFLLTLLQLWLGLSPWGAVLVCAVGGFIYELGQTDTAYNPLIVRRDTQQSPLGTPGFGISPLDLVWNLLGALAAVGLGALLS